MYKRNQVFAAACIGLLLFGIMLITLGSILPSLAAKFKLNEISSGKLVSILPVGIIAGSLVFGPVADRYGYKMMFIITTLLMTLAFESLAFADSFFLLQGIQNVWKRYPGSKAFPVPRSQRKRQEG